MEDPSKPAETTGPAEDPPPQTSGSAQDRSRSESLLDSAADSGSLQKRPPPPPSPLTGCYLLIVVGEPHSDRHKEIILQKVAKGFLSWDVNECHVSLEKELQAITVQSPEGEEGRYGERLIQYATENLVTEILIHPQLNTLHQCMRNLLSSFTKHRHIIHAGYTFAGNGSWILQDGTLSISDLVEALHETEVLRVLKAYENSVSIDVHCAPEGDWSTERFQREPVSKLCNVRINPDDVMTAGDPAISGFIDYLAPFLEPANIQQLLQPTDVVGNIRFTHPTLYVFPGGQGDAALFGINGFNMLVDGGFARKACFWDFARHLDRLDAVLLTRLNNSTVNGISAVLQRKKMNHVYPQIGHFFCNLQDRKIALSPDGDKDKDSLIVNLAEEGQEIVANLRHLALKPHPCYRDGNQVDPVNLYHKVGHGKLDMYVISPARDSQAVKEFLSKWNSNDNQLFSFTGKKIGARGFDFPLQNLVSICALLVWQPANPNDAITRILFPGSTPQHKIFEGLDKLRHLEFLKHPICSARSISPSASTVTVTRSLSKTRQFQAAERAKAQAAADQKSKDAKPALDQKPKSTTRIIRAKTDRSPPKEVKPKTDTNKLIEEKKEIEKSKVEPVKKIDDRVFDKDEQLEKIEKEIQKIEQEHTIQKIETDIKKLEQNEEEAEKQIKKIVHRSKYDMKNVKSKVDSRAPSKSTDRKKLAEKKAENGGSPPGTPKKGLTNGTASKAEKAKTVPKPTKASPSSTPAKSAKEANNRKVVEARVVSRASSVSRTAASRPVPKKEETQPQPVAPSSAAPAKTERKPISRRPKAPSPAKKAPASPVKSTAAKGGKAEQDAAKKVKRKLPVDLEKATTDSTVSTPSAETDAAIPKKESDEKPSEPEPLAQNAKTDTEDVTEDAAKSKEAEDATENVETDVQAVKDQVPTESEKIPLTSKLSQESAKSGETEKSQKGDLPEEEEDEYLIITKEDSTEESGKAEESEKEQENDSLQEEVETKDETEGEGETKKILRDEEDSEKRRKIRGEEVDEEALEEAEKDDKADESTQRIEEVINESEEALKQDEQDVKGESKDRSKENGQDVVEEEATTTKKIDEDKKPEGEGSEESPQEKSSDRKETRESDLQKLTDPDEGVDLKEPVSKEHKEGESLPDEKFSTTVETSATTAPTLPEDERIEEPVEEENKVPLDEIKEVVEEKYIKEETKEDKLQEEIKPRPEQPSTLPKTSPPPPPPVYESSQPRAHPRDIVKTPDEVADLPVHEEVDPRMYSSGEFSKDLHKHEEESKEREVKSDSSKDEKEVEDSNLKQEFKEIIKGEANLLDEEDTEETRKLETVDKTEESIENKTQEKKDEIKVEPDLETGCEKHPEEPKILEKIEAVTDPAGEALATKYLDIIDKLEKTSESTDQMQLKEKISTEKDFEPSAIENGQENKNEIPVELDTDEKANASPSPSPAGESVEKIEDGKTSPAQKTKEISLPPSPVPSDKGSSRQASPPLQKYNGEPVEEVAAAASLESLRSGKATPVPDRKESIGEKSLDLKPEDIPLSGKSTPHLSDKDSRQSTPAPTVETEESQSGKMTPEPMPKSDSARSTPAPEAEKTSAVSSAVTSGKASPDKDVKSPSPKPDASIDLNRLSPAIEEKILSGKASPEKEQSGKTSPISEEKIASGKETPTPSEKDTHGRATPTSAGKVSSGRTTPTSTGKVSSGRTTPVEKSTSGKSTPLLDERETSRKSSLAEDDKTAIEQNKMSSIAENVVPDETETEVPAEPLEAAPSAESKSPSAKSPSPSPKSASGKTSPLVADKDYSGKISPVRSDRGESEATSPAPSEKDVRGKTSPEEVDKMASGKTTPALSEKSSPGKTSPDAIEKISGKTSPASPNVQASGKTTPDKITSGKTTPHSEGKISPECQGNIPSGKTSPKDEDRVPSGKVTPIGSDKDALENPPADSLSLSGKATPAPSEKDASGKTTPEVADKAASGKTTPAPSEKGLSGKATSEILEKSPSGKTTPALSEKGFSGKATPEIPEKSLSGKTTPALSDKETSGKITPVSEKGESGKVTPSDLGQKSPDVPKFSTPCNEKETLDRSGGQTPAADVEKSVSLSKEKESLPISDGKLETSSEITSETGKDTLHKEEITKSGQSSEQASGKATPITELEKGKKSETEQKSSPSPSGAPTNLPAATESPDIPSVQGKASLSDVLVRKSTTESSGKSTPCEKLSSGKSTPLEKMTNGICVGDESDELEKGILESERHEKESHVSEEISSDEEEELKALEQGDDNEDSEPEEEITRERLQSLAHGEITAATPDSVPESPAVKKTAGSEVTSESPKLDAEKTEKETVQEAASDSPSSIQKNKKDDINEFVKSGGSNEDGNAGTEPDNHAAVKRMLVTASSEDGGTETEICAQGSIRLSKSEAGADEDAEKGSSSPEGSDADEDKGEEFSSLILQARKEYNLQRSRKSSCNSPDRESPVDDGKESFSKECREEQASPNQALTEDSTDTISTEQSSVLQKTEISKEVESDGRVDQTDLGAERKLSKTKTTSRSESSRMDEADIITITTILTEEREEQEDGTYKVTTTKEVVTKGGKDAGSVVTINTNVMEADDSRLKSPTSKDDSKVEEKISETVTASSPKPTGTQDSRLEADVPKSPLSVISPSPTPGFDFDDYRRSTCGDFDSKIAEERKSSTSSTIAFSEPGKSSEETALADAKVCIEDASDKDRSRKSSTGSQDEKRTSSKEESEGKVSQGDQDAGQREESRRTSASSTISQEDLVSRKDSTRIEEFRTGSVELSPLKTTYITSQASSEAGESQLMTSSFYGVLPTEDEMILSASYGAGKPETSSEIRKGKGYESVTEIGPDGEKTERTYFYGTDPEPEPGLTGTFYMKGIPEPIPEAPEITPDKPSFVETFPTKDSFLPEEHMDFAKAVEEHISARGEDLSKNYQFDLGKHSSDKSSDSSAKQDAEKADETKKSKPATPSPSPSPSSDRKSGDKEEKSPTEKKKDAIEGWGKPLGLPLPPKNLNRTTIFPGQNISTTSSLSTPSDNSDSVTNWGQPMSLPSPAPPAAQNGSTEPLTDKSGSVAKDTPKKEKRPVQTKKNVSSDNKSSGNNTPNRRSESPVKPTEKRAPSLGRNNKPANNTPIYLDLTYVPHHGNSYYSNVEFFKRIRARYYVFSGTEPSKEVYNALLEAKQTWDDKDLEVTIIPTYDTDVLGYWVAENEEVLAKHKIDLSPSASRCTINLQDHETSCSAYRLEF